MLRMNINIHIIIITVNINLNVISIKNNYPNIIYNLLVIELIQS